MQPPLGTGGKLGLVELLKLLQTVNLELPVLIRLEAGMVKVDLLDLHGEVDHDLLL